MSQHLPSPVNFREDINGLRAWAVMAVLFFHFSWIGLPGGFAGVDMFFVISGYLMTAIVVGGHTKGNFSLQKFYLARIRRILPALLVMMASVLIVGWFWLPALDYQALGEQSAYALGFISNMHFWWTTGYFDSVAHDKWLLHTWSLAVEAQFYLLYPLFIALVWRFAPNLRAVFWAVLALFIGSLLLNLVVVYPKPTMAFFWLPTRAWELAAGGLVYLLVHLDWVKQTIKQRGFWLGWGLILASLVFLDEQLAWPGFWAILPVLGTSLIILAARESCLLTDNRVAQWLGDRSYSLYLWHWPLVVALYYAGLQNEWLWVVAGLAVSLVLAHLSYHWIEVPTRQYLSQTTLKKEVFVIAGVAGSLLVTTLWVQQAGVMSRAVNQTPQSAYMNQYLTENYKPKTESLYLLKCDFYDSINVHLREGGIAKNCVASQPKGVMLWGDSHAQALSYGLRQQLALIAPKAAFSQIATSACRPNLNPDTITVGEFKTACDLSNSAALKAVEQAQPSLLILAQQAEHERSQLLSVAQAALEKGVERVVIMGPLPQWGIDLPRLIARTHWDSGPGKIQDRLFNQALWQTDQMMKEQVKVLDNSNIQYVSILDELCDEKGCMAILDDKRTPLAFDYGHLTKEGTLFVGDKVMASPLLSWWLHYQKP